MEALPMENKSRDSITDARQVAFPGLAVASEKPDETTEEREERLRLKAAWNKEQSRRQDLRAHEAERSAWRHRSEDAATARAMTPAQRLETERQLLQTLKVDVVYGALPDVGENPEAPQLWDRVRGQIDTILGKLPDETPEKWNAILVGMGLGFLPDDDAGEV